MVLDFLSPTTFIQPWWSLFFTMPSIVWRNTMKNWKLLWCFLLVEVRYLLKNNCCYKIYWSLLQSNILSRNIYLFSIYHFLFSIIWFINKFLVILIIQTEMILVIAAVDFTDHRIKNIFFISKPCSILKHYSFNMAYLLERSIQFIFLRPTN